MILLRAYSLENREYSGKGVNSVCIIYTRDSLLPSGCALPTCTRGPSNYNSTMYFCTDIVIR